MSDLEHGVIIEGHFLSGVEQRVFKNLGFGRVAELEQLISDTIATSDLSREEVIRYLDSNPSITD